MQPHDDLRHAPGHASPTTPIRRNPPLHRLLLSPAGFKSEMAPSGQPEATKALAFDTLEFPLPYSFMKPFFAIVLVALVAWSVYDGNPFTENITIMGDAVSVDAGDYDVEFEALREYRTTYMLFGGEYSRNASMNPITLFGLGMNDARQIHARYPDFHRCKSPGAQLAQPKVKWLNLIPADKQVLDDLRASIEEFEDNLGSDGDRVCVSLTGKTLRLKSDRVPVMHKDSSGRLVPPTYELINSSKVVNCKSLLDQA